LKTRVLPGGKGGLLKRGKSVRLRGLGGYRYSLTAEKVKGGEGFGPGLLRKGGGERKESCPKTRAPEEPSCLPAAKERTRKIHFLVNVSI